MHVRFTRDCFYLFRLGQIFSTVAVTTTIMPLCYVNTNLPSSPMLENFAKSFSEEISKVLKKPIERIRVVIESGQHLVVAGTTEPATIIRIYSIGVFDQSRNPGYTEQLVPFVSNALELDPPRISFLYLPIDSSMVGSGK